MGSITIVGLGPAGPEQVTAEALSILSSASSVWLRTSRHPAVSAIPDRVPTQSFDDEYERAESFTELYTTIAGRLLAMAKTDSVVYAVPGHPLVAEATVRHIQKSAPEQGISVRIVAGLSFVEPALAAVGVDPFEQGLQIADAADITVDPFRPVLVGQIYNQRVTGIAKVDLLEIYPPEHPSRLILHAGLPDQRVIDGPLYEIDRHPDIDHLACLYLPALPILEGGGTHATLKEVIARLRKECPWDREQTHESLRPYLIEETFEALEALESGDLTKFAEELGDVLLQIYLHAAIAEETEAFSLRDVFAAITAKLIRRHPHVFADVNLNTAEQVAQNWERLKSKERKHDESMLSGVPKSMPALAYVQNLQRRAAGVGFEWPNVDGAWLKLAEELGELRTAASNEERLWELGDVLFVLVDLARWYGFEAEDALRLAAGRFRRRFGWIERQSKEAERALDSLSLDEWLAYWKGSKPAAIED